MTPLQTDGDGDSKVRLCQQRALWDTALARIFAAWEGMELKLGRVQSGIVCIRGCSVEAHLLEPTPEGGTPDASNAGDLQPSALVPFHQPLQVAPLQVGQGGLVPKGVVCSASTLGGVRTRPV